MTFLGRMKALFVVLVVALVLVAGAYAKPSTMSVDGDGGGTPSISLWWVSYWSGYVNGHYYEYRCLWGSDGYTVYQIRCETDEI